MAAFTEDTMNRELLLNVEYKGDKDCVSFFGFFFASLLPVWVHLTYSSLTPQVTLMSNESDAASRKDIARELIADGLVCVDNRRERRLQKLVTSTRVSISRAIRGLAGIDKNGQR